ncbi:MAG: hypothetical protein LAP21_15250 [Acidobacteriia bacterium]|nr:hypothetical protein [Terriglobia bacterium]
MRKTKQKIKLDFPRAAKFRMHVRLTRGKKTEERVIRTPWPKLLYPWELKQEIDSFVLAFETMASVVRGMKEKLKRKRITKRKR